MESSGTVAAETNASIIRKPGRLRKHPIRAVKERSLIGPSKEAVLRGEASFAEERNQEIFLEVSNKLRYLVNHYGKQRLVAEKIGIAESNISIYLNRNYRRIPPTSMRLLIDQEYNRVKVTCEEKNESPTQDELSQSIIAVQNFLDSSNIPIATLDTFLSTFHTLSQVKQAIGIIRLVKNE